MTAVLAVDGGQSGIRARTDAEDRVVEVDGVSRLEGDVDARVAEAVRRAWLSLDAPTVSRAVLGLTTSPATDTHAARLARLVHEATGATEVWITDDAVTAHAGALPARRGVALVVGTGTACLAVDGAWQVRMVDGHGYLLGDEGSAFWIGKEGLRAALRAADGRAEPTALAASAEERFGPLPYLAAQVHSEPRAVNAIAQFAPVVIAAAARDSVAADIVDRAAHALAETAAAAVRWAHQDQPEVPLVLAGRALPQDSPLRSRLVTLLAERASLPYRLTAPFGDGLTGALHLAVGGSVAPYGDLVDIAAPAVPA